MLLLNERLRNLLFLELKKEKAAKIFNLNELKNYNEEIFIPVNTNFIVENLENENAINNLPIEEFIKGMAYAMAADPEFKFSNIYFKMLKNAPNCEVILKKLSSTLFKEGKKIDCFIILKALNMLFKNKDVEDTLLNLAEEIALSNLEFVDNALDVSNDAIENGNINGYLISGSLYRIKNEAEKVILNLREYVANGGEETSDISSEIKSLERNLNIEEAYKNLLDNPKPSLEVFLSYYNEERSNPKLLLNIGIAYRLLENYEKAIIYLEEAMEIDQEYLDILNELGLNHALINDYETASRYFKPVYEATKELAPLTNLIICYFNLGRLEEAKELLKIAKTIDTEDEIISIIEKTYL